MAPVEARMALAALLGETDAVAALADGALLTPDLAVIASESVGTAALVVADAAALVLARNYALGCEGERD